MRKGVTAIKTPEIKFPVSKEVNGQVVTETYTARVDFNAFAELEELYGTVDDALAAIEKGSIKAIRNLLWASMITQHPGLTVGEVGRMINEENMKNLTAQLQLLFMNSMPEAENESINQGNAQTT